MYLYCLAVEAGFYSDIQELSVRSVGSQSSQKSLRVYRTSLKTNWVFIETLLLLIDQTQFHQVKGIVSGFDYLEFCPSVSLYT